MGQVVEFPKPKPEVKAVTCGCGGQMFILVVDADEKPDFLYCVDCQHRMADVAWRRVPAA